MLAWSETSLSVPVPVSVPYPGQASQIATRVEPSLEANMPALNNSARLAIGWSETQLAEYFSRSAAPPILATVETSSRWLWMRKELTSMTASSHMVKFGVIAFVALELESAGALERSTYSQYYHIAKERLGDCLKEISHDCKAISSHLRHILAVLFLLSYIDLLTKDVSNAHANLRDGFNALQMVDIESLGVTGETGLARKLTSHLLMDFLIRKTLTFLAKASRCQSCQRRRRGPLLDRG